MSEDIIDEARKAAEREKADRDKTDRERMIALGYDADNPATVARYKDLKAKRDAGTINGIEFSHEMDRGAWEQEDKERRDAARAERDPRAALNKSIEETERRPSDREAERDARAALSEHIEKAERQPGERSTSRDVLLEQERDAKREITEPERKKKDIDRDL
jgi:hypothetical protein